MSETYQEILERDMREHRRHIDVLHGRWIEACRERNALAERLARVEAAMRTAAHATDLCVTGPRPGEPHDWTIPQYGRIACCAYCGANKAT